jgi:hypothetical protein
LWQLLPVATATTNGSALLLMLLVLLPASSAPRKPFVMA